MNDEIKESGTESVESVKETITLSKEELNKMLQDGFKQMLSDYMMSQTKPEPIKEEIKKEETLEDYLF